MLAVMIILGGLAFIVGVLAIAVYNYTLLRKWRRETQPRKQRWYHTWHRL